MELCIGNETTVRDVQMQFNTLYPFLQIHFLKSMQAGGNNAQTLQKANPDSPIKNLRPIQSTANFSIANVITVAQLLKNFRDIGLLVQVSRKSGNHWIETTLTADWTLERQNREAMLIGIAG